MTDKEWADLWIGIERVGSQLLGTHNVTYGVRRTTPGGEWIAYIRPVSSPEREIQAYGYGSFMDAASTLLGQMRLDYNITLGQQEEPDHVS